MSSAPITFDLSTAKPIPGVADSPSPMDDQASALQGAVSYASQQNPDRYAKLLQFQKLTGVPPVVSAGNEQQVQQAADANSIDPRFLTTIAPRTSGWASNPDNAAVSGVGEIQRVAGIEQNAVAMRAYTPTFGEKVSDKLLDLGQWMMGGTISKDQLRQNFWQGPVTRGAADIVGGVAGMAGNIGAALGWHGDGPTRKNLLQRIESSLDPANAGVYVNGQPDKGNGFDFLMKNVAPMVPAVLASGGVSALADTLKVSPVAAKVVAGLTVGGMFDLDQAGKTYTAVAGSGGSEDAARLAANRVALINALPNALFGATDVVPFLRDNPLLTSIGLGGATGATGQIGQNVVTGKPLTQGVLSSALQGAAMQGGMHLGMGSFGDHIAQAVDAAADSKLRARSPEKFQEAMQAVFAGDQSLRIPSEQFTSYFTGKGMDPAEVAKGLGSTNYPEAVLSGGDVEVTPADFLSKLDPEHQKALLPHIVDPSTGLTATQHQEGLAELQEWATNGGAEKLAAETAAADAETAASPEFQAVKEQLRKRYVDAGEAPEVAETLATKDANAYSNLARNAGMKPNELLSLYNPKVVTGEAPEATEADLESQGILHQSGNFGPKHEQFYHDAKGAIDQLLADKSGEAVAALHHPDVGDIDLVYGKERSSESSGFGLAKIAQLHPEVLDDLQGFLDGMHVESKSENRIRLADDSGKAVVRLSREGSDRPWLLTAFGKKNEASAADSGTTAVTNRAEPAPENPAGQEADKEILHQSDDEMQPRGWFRVLPDGSYEIGKTKIGDLSTFVHEPAHAYLKIIGDLAKRDGASETLKGDYQKILDFLGAKEGEPLTREQQETWARANEQYLREGKAPSQGLKGAFQRFAIWLGSVYKKASHLGVNLSDDIRGVFDRLYAAEEGVNRAEAEAGPKLFTNAEEAGWTDEQFKNYADAKGIEVEQAKSEILAKLNEAALREKTEAWREEEKNVREAVTADIDQKPEYRAIRALRKGKLDDGSDLTMNRDELVKQFGAERVKELQRQHPGLYRNEGGYEPETAAEMLGFDSAESMMKSIESAPRRSAAIEQATRDYMTAKHGDIRYDRALQDQARLALENDKRAENLHRELNALNRRNNPEFELREAHRELRRYANEQAGAAKQQGRLEARDERIAALKQKVADLQESIRTAKREGREGARTAQDVAPIAAYREAAHQMVESKAVADLQPTRYLDASRKYSREAIEALAKGDYEGAKQAKHKELMNHFLFREATKAKEYIGKFESYAKRMQTKPVQQKLGLAGDDYRDQFNRILGRYGLGPAVGPAERTLAEWSAAQYNAGKEPAIDPSILNEARTVNYRNAPVSEIRAVHDALVNVRKLASLELAMDVNGRKVEFNTAVESMIARAHESLKTRPTPVFEEDTPLTEEGRNLVERGTSTLARTEFVMKKLDGGVTGPWHDNLWNLAADAQGVERQLQEEVTGRIGDALAKMPEDQRMKMLDKVTVPGIGTITRKRLISMAFNMGNEGNLDRLEKTFLAHGWDPAAIEHIKGALTREEWQFVQDGWDTLKVLGEKMNEMERRLTGLPPVMVRPTPLHLTLTDGSEMELDGGYYPIVMDPKYSDRGAQQDASVTAQNLMETGYGRAVTSRGYTKERTGFGGPLQLDYEQVLTQHLAKVSKDISHREFMLAANKLVMDPRIRQTMRETLGESYEQKMMPWLRTIINDRNGSAVQGLGDVSNWMSKLRTNVVEASLCFKASTMLLQLTHAPSMFLYARPASYGQAMVDFLAHPSEMTEQIRNLSPNEMQDRGENIDRDMRQVLQDGIGERKLGKAIARAGFFPIKMMDHLLSYPLWLSVYRDALEENVNLSEKEARYQAMHKADGAVRMGLGSNAPKDLPAIMRKNDFWKLVTTLGGFENLKWNQMADVTHGFAEDRRAGASLSLSAGRLTYGMLMTAVIPAVVGAYVSGDRPKDDENAGEWAARRALLFPLETVPLLGNVSRAIDERNDAKFTPLVNMVDKAVTAGSQATSGKEDKDWTGIGLNASEAAGQAFGVPGTTQMMRTARYARRAQQGRIPDPSLLDAVLGAPHK